MTIFSFISKLSFSNTMQKFLPIFYLGAFASFICLFLLFVLATGKGESMIWFQSPVVSRELIPYLKVFVLESMEPIESQV